ncbi:MAG: serine/threonine-protein kinase [Gemmatimonadota bacterium]|nr:serine/threonine-protein kinase [Gemmatimonadota bacterium]
MSDDGAPTRGSAEGPAHIGPYRILQMLGEGGMGLVYEAQQTTPVRRRVALKIIKLGMDTNEVVARFELERQALAVMDHPSIAHVFDGGSTTDGRPYFVMELVKGTPITDYCDTHKLPTEERLELFTQVCAAVQHAHQKGVIHRDLKPSNVLVTVQDGVPVPKVIDFGIAKAVGSELTERTPVTRLGSMVGTPEYMSPEQAEMSGLDVDTRTDLYSLGVMLYELLTGALPYDLSQVADAALFSVIREKEPPTPSARLGTLSGDMQETIARYRHTDSSTLKRALAGDLDWVVMKCIEKDRTRRYETANELAIELGRIRRHEPVLARPPSTRYRLGKFVRRHQAGVAAAAVTILAVVGGASAAIVGMVRAQRAEAVAGLESETAQQVSDFLVGLFEVSDPSESRGNEITAREILDAGAERIRSALGDQPAVQGRLMTTMGRVYRGLGIYGESEVLLTDVLEIRERELGPRHPDVALTLTELGIGARAAGRLTQARERLERALDIYETEGHAAGTARVLTLLAHLDFEPDFAKAEANLVRALDLAQSLPTGPIPELNGIPAKSLLADIHLSLGTTLSNRIRVEARDLNSVEGWHFRSEPSFQTALALKEELYGPDDSRLVETLLSLARLYLRQDEDMGRAGPLFRRALSIRERTLPPDHPVLASTLFEVATGYLGDPAYSFSGPDTIALPLLSRAREIQEGRPEGETPQLARTLANTAVLHMRRRELADAAPLLERALVMVERTEGPDSRRAEDVAENLADVYRGRGDAEGLETFLAGQLAAREEAPGSSYRTFASRLASFQRDRGRVRESDATYARATRLLEETGPADLVWGLLFEWGELLRTEGRPADAAPVFERAIRAGYEAGRPDLERRFGYPGDRVLRGLQRLLTVQAELGDDEAIDSLVLRMAAIPADTTPAFDESGEAGSTNRVFHPARLRDAGVLLRRAGRAEQGDLLLGRAAAIRDWDDDARTRDGWTEPGRAVALHNSGIIYELWGREEEAGRRYLEAARMLDEHPETLGQDAGYIPTYANFVTHAARSLVRHPHHYFEGGEIPVMWRAVPPEGGDIDYAGAEALWQRAIVVYDSVAAAGETSANDQGAYSTMLAQYAFVLREQGQETEARAAEDLAPNQCTVSFPKIWRAFDLRRREMTEEAESEFTLAREQLIRCGTQPWNVAWVDFGLAMVEQSRGDVASAEARLRRAATTWEQSQLARGQYATALHALANLLRDAGRTDEAASTYERALTVFDVVSARVPDFHWRVVPPQLRRAVCEADYAAMTGEGSP